MRTAFDLSESATRQVVSAAGRAPSLLNTQPWRFRRGPATVLLLHANAFGLTATFLSQPIEVAEQRRQLRRLLANRLHPQAILRLGFTPAVTTSTPRRNAADLLLAQTPAGRP